MTTFETVCLLGLGATLVGVATHFALRGRHAARGGVRSEVPGSEREVGVSVGRVRTPAELRAKARRRVVHAVATVGFLGCVTTAAGGMVVSEGPHGWWLLGHMVFAPVFAVGLAVAGVAWAGRFGGAIGGVPDRASGAAPGGESGGDPAGATCGGADGPTAVATIGASDGASAGASDRRGDRARREIVKAWMFWAGQAVGLTVVLSMALTMTRWLDQSTLRVWFEVHRYAALALTVLMVVHAYWTWLRRRAKRAS